MEVFSTFPLHLLTKEEFIFYLHFPGCARKISKICCFTLSFMSKIRRLINLSPHPCTYCINLPSTQNQNLMSLILKDEEIEVYCSKTFNHSWFKLYKIIVLKWYNRRYSQKKKKTNRIFRVYVNSLWINSHSDKNKGPQKIWS